MQTYQDSMILSKNNSVSGEDKNKDKNIKTINTNKASFKEKEEISNKNQLGIKNFIETIYKKTLPNSNMINEENLKIVNQSNKFVGNKKEIGINYQTNDIPVEIKSHRQSNNNINIGNVSNKDLDLANKIKNERKISNSLVLEINDASSLNSKEKQNLNSNDINIINKKQVNSQHKIKNIYLNVNNINGDSTLSENLDRINNNQVIKNIQINTTKTSNNLNKNNSEKYTETLNAEDINKLANNINNKNCTQIIEHKLNLKNTENKDKYINKSNIIPQEENNNIMKNIQKSSEREKDSRSNSNKNKSKTKFKSNKKLENHLGIGTKTFYGNNKINEKTESASSSSGFTNFFSKNKGHTNTKSEFDVTKNLNLTLKNNNTNKQLGKNIKIINNINNGNKHLHSQFTQNIENNGIEDYYKIKCIEGNKENNQCNIIRKSSALVDKKNKTSTNLQIIDQPDKIEFNFNNQINKKKNLDMNKQLANKEMMIDNVNNKDNIYSSNKANNNYLNNLKTNLNHTVRKSMKTQRISIYSNDNSRNNSSENIGEIPKIEEKVINTSRVFSANTKLEKISRKDNIFKILENDTKEKNISKDNLMFNNYNKISDNFINNLIGQSNNKISFSDENKKILNNNNLNKNSAEINSFSKDFNEKKNCSNVNENVFLDKIKQKREKSDVSYDIKINTDKINRKNLSSNGLYNNSNTNIKFIVTNETNGKMEYRIESPTGKIDTKKLKIMIINKETNINNLGKHYNIEPNKLNILGTNSNCDEVEEPKTEKISNSNNIPNNLNLPKMKNIRIENFPRIEFENLNIKHNDINHKKNNSNINKTYSTLAKKLKKSKEIKQVLECSSNSHFEIISSKQGKKEEEILINRNKSYDMSKNLSNKNTENKISPNHCELNNLNENFDLIKRSLDLKINSNSNSKIYENNVNKAFKNEIVTNNFNFEDQLNKESLNFCSNKRSKNRFISKNNIINSVNNDLNFNTKTTKDTLKLSDCQNKNFSHIEIEGPEELHMLYINLNQQNKKLIYKFEKIDDTIKSDKDNTYTVHHYDNEVEI